MLTRNFAPMILVALAVVASSPLSASSAEMANLVSGARVRATAGGLPSEITNAKTVTGYFVSQNDSTITMDVSVTIGGSGHLLVIPRENLETLERSVQSSRRGKNAGVGLVVGAGLGVAMGLASGDDNNDEIISFSAETKAAMGALIFGLIGTLAGSVSAPGEEWETVSTQPVQVGLSQGARGETGFYISARF